MKQAALREMIPKAHGRLLPAFYDRPQLVETRATCDDCAMCAKGAGASTPGVFFKPELKCCTYQPTLPNFLVGAILADDSPEMAEGRRRIRERIASRIGVTPRWLAPPRKHRVLLEAARGSSFGRSKVLQCPYYENNGGLCTIWRHRESICSTFFCKHDRGAAGHAFWMANKSFLGLVELTLAKAAALSVSENVAEPNIPRLVLTVEDLEDRPPNDEAYASYWGEWAHREEELYLACFAYVEKLAPTDLESLLADDIEDRAPKMLADATAKYDAVIEGKLAERLIPNPAMRTTKMPAGIAVTSYSLFDAQCLSEDLFAVVNEFKATETVIETRARLKREHDLDIPDDLLLSLQQHEILVPPASS